jgi:hypothetical protein
LTKTLKEVNIRSEPTQIEKSRTMTDDLVDIQRIRQTVQLYLKNGWRWSQPDLLRPKMRRNIT